MCHHYSVHNKTDSTEFDYYVIIKNKTPYGILDSHRLQTTWLWMTTGNQDSSVFDVPAGVTCKKMTADLKFSFEEIEKMLYVNNI